VEKRHISARTKFENLRKSEDAAKDQYERANFNNEQSQVDKVRVLLG
jgi:hypothetical protein